MLTTVLSYVYLGWLCQKSRKCTHKDQSWYMTSRNVLTLSAVLPSMFNEPFDSTIVGGGLSSRVVWALLQPTYAVYIKFIDIQSKIA